MPGPGGPGTAPPYRRSNGTVSPYRLPPRSRCPPSAPRGTVIGRTGEPPRPAFCLLVQGSWSARYALNTFIGLDSETDWSVPIIAGSLFAAKRTGLPTGAEVRKHFSKKVVDFSDKLT